MPLLHAISNEVNTITLMVQKPIRMYNELRPLTLHSNLTCFSVASTYEPTNFIIHHEYISLSRICEFGLNLLATNFVAIS